MMGLDVSSEDELSIETGQTIVQAAHDCWNLLSGLKATLCRHYHLSQARAWHRNSKLHGIPLSHCSLKDAPLF